MPTLAIADAIDDFVIAITATEGMRRNKCLGLTLREWRVF
jgi:hypothetical protein